MANAQGLTAEQIQVLMGKTRARGVWLERLNEFVKSGLNGAAVSTLWPDAKGKKLGTIKQGFIKAKEHKDADPLAKYVNVIESDDDIFLVNLVVAGYVTPGDEETAPAEDTAEVAT